MKKNNNLILVGIIGFILISILIGGTLSVIDTEDSGGCKIVKKGNVCDKYTKCEYDSVRDISCIKGYEIVSEEIPPPTKFDINIISGGV